MIYKNMWLIVLLFVSFFSVAFSSETSLYQLNTKWTDEKNKDFNLNQLKGKKVVMAMAYTSCQGTCPMIVSKIKKIERLFTENKIAVEVVIITFDPAFDNAERSTFYYREKMSIKNENWHFLSASESKTREMSMILGIKYAKNPQSGAIIHDNKIVLLNEEGEIIKRIESLEEEESKLLN